MKLVANQSPGLVELDEELEVEEVEPEDLVGPEDEDDDAVCCKKYVF